MTGKNLEGPTTLLMDTAVPGSACCECGHPLNGCTGPGKPSPGDYTLCIRCTSLNVFGEDLVLRTQTDAEIFAAAADSELQSLRRILLDVNKHFPDVTPG